MKRSLDLFLHALLMWTLNVVLLALVFAAGYEYGRKKTIITPHPVAQAIATMPPAIVDHEAIAQMRPNKENCR